MDVEVKCNSEGVQGSKLKSEHAGCLALLTRDGTEPLFERQCGNLRELLDIPPVYKGH